MMAQRAREDITGWLRQTSDRSGCGFPKSQP
jgi:hypothetical protein